MSRFHVVVPTRPPAAVPRADFVTDPRRPNRAADHELVARGADLAGWDGAYVPFDPDGRDAIVTGAGLLRGTRRLSVTVDLHPAAGSPVYLAKLSASLQGYTAARLGWHLTVELDPAVARAHGDTLAGPARYARAQEFLTVAKGVWTEPDYGFDGTYFAVLDGGLPASRSPRPFPRVFLSGNSDEALALSARHADVHVLGPGEDPALVPAGVVPAVRLREPSERDLRAAADAGFAEFVVEFEDAVEGVYRLGQLVLPGLRAAGKENAGVG